MSEHNASSSGIKCAIELEQKQNTDEHVYEKITQNRANTKQFEIAKTEENTIYDKSEKKTLGTRQLIVAVLCGVVVCLVVSVVSATAAVYVIFTGSDGGWTNWGDWGTCSVTCGGGLVARSRTCSNPRPSFMGKYCDGTSDQMKICNNIPCLATIGGWTSWGDWGNCSVTCGGGLIARSRTCSNPKPSSQGEYCDGTSDEVKLCNNIPCPGSGLGFSVYEPNSTSDGNPLTFQTELYNSDAVFNMTSGTFVCKQEGLYFFVTTLLRKKNKPGGASCYFVKNDIISPYIAAYAYGQSNWDFPSATNSILYYLKPGDRVYLGSCSLMSHLDSSSSFSGFLVSPFY